MIFHPKVEKICNFTEACEWIAFGCKSTELIYKLADASLLDENRDPKYNYTHDKNYLKGIKFTSYKLVLAIYERKIPAVGTKISIYCKCDDKMHRVRLDNGGNPDFSFDGINTSGLYNYKHVCMNFKTVQKCFPRDENGNPLFPYKGYYNLFPFV